ncbi:MAG: plasma-membrane proton-efflux P-type ATPase [Deltaproteobacteria bacterium]|jgi:H+-transporting ATPase
MHSDDAQEYRRAERTEESQSASKGLTKEEALSRLEQYGPNTIEEEKKNPILQFLSYFWGPIPWMIEVAAILSALVHHWAEFDIILVLLLFNALVGFWQEHQASNALEELKGHLAPRARVLRDGEWQDVPARELVPGDYIRIFRGDIVPADVKLVEGDYVSVDESALTGESLPVDKAQEDMAYSGSVIKRGEMDSLVIETGTRTKFGRTARLVKKAGAISHFQKTVLHIADYLIYISLGLALILIITQLYRGESILSIFQFVLILVVAAIPVALPAVLSVTMALGAVMLSKEKAIVSRLRSIEEIAGIDVLCVDKTGTLTKNELTLGDPVIFDAQDTQSLILIGALASKEEELDAIDQAVRGALEDQEKLKAYQLIDFVPFDPVRKRTEATVKDQDGRTFQVSKGAPQVIIQQCELDNSTEDKAKKTVDDLASKGYRTLGVSRRNSPNEPWRLLGFLPLYDPPREDSAPIIQQSIEHGIQVKMVTGDNTAIAKEISRQLQMNTNIRSADEIFPEKEDPDHLSNATIGKIEKADGFAQVFPEHKYGIIKALQARNHIVGMTGDGVNDAPALKQADVGIAVSGATSAARSAAALVLSAPGLSVIIKAIEEARRIFERMNSYAVYRITETIRVLFFVVLTMLIFDFYPVTTILIILLALLNDIPIMVIAYDNTWLDPQPVRWNMRRVLTISTTLGLVGVAETFGIMLIGVFLLDMSPDQLRSFIYLKLAVAGHLTLFVVRSKQPFFKKPYPAPALFFAVVATQMVAAMIVGFGIFVTPVPWSYVGLVWAYCLVWVFIEDWIKLELDRHLNLQAARHKSFIDRLQERLH